MIKTERLSKQYGTLTAVDAVSFEVQAGEVLGFLGPNGAGKTTTMRMIAGFIAPTSGTASVCGHDVQSDPLAAKRSIGYLPEGAPLYGEMSVRGFLEFIAELRGLTGSARASRLEFVIARLQLASVLAQSIETLSKGFRRRVGLAQALLQDPPVLILDEPTDGLDPNQKHEVRRIPQELAAARAAIAALPDVESVEMSEREARLTALPHAGAQILPAVSELAAQRVLNLKELHLESGRLDEVFRSITA
jgi:ABC-2 type transport system ATP-binding protein